MKPFSRNMESLNIYTISMYYTWSNSGFTHTNPRRPQFIKEAHGKDLRCFVIDGKVVATIEREAAPGDFRANLHQGGKARIVRISKEERQLAVKAAKTLELSVAGVDIIRSQSGPLLLEVNSSPGLEGIQTATGKDIAGMMISSIEKQLNWSREPALAEVGKTKMAS